MTVNEFLARDIEGAPGRRWQLVDGEHVLMTPTAEVHGLIQAEISGPRREDSVRQAGRAASSQRPGSCPGSGRIAEVLRRDGDGNWPEAPEIPGPCGRVVLVSIGFDCPLQDMYAASAIRR